MRFSSVRFVPWRFVSTVTTGALVVLLAACDMSIPPAAPSATSALPSVDSSVVPRFPFPPRYPTPDPSGLRSAAEVEIRSFALRYTGTSNGLLWYLPELVLAETAGRSAARLASLWFETPGGGLLISAEDTPPGTGCFLTPESRVVPAGGEWAATQVYRYCLDVDVPTQFAGRLVSLQVGYQAEAGVSGYVTATATAAAP